jgi:DNA polymerase I-like protein with 3'-5' exonuclease and polymerase domains
MLDHKFRIEALEAHGNFEVAMRRDLDWSSSPKRVLIIIQTVDGADLNEGCLGSTPALVNAIKYGKQIARLHKSSSTDGCAFAVTNFNARRHLHLKGQARAEAEAEFRVRQHKLIKKLDPTHILFSGDASLMFPITNPHMKNGWVHKIDGRRVVSTLDFGRLMEKQGVYANLLGFFCRHLAHLLIGYHPHDLSKVSATPVLVDTIEKFDKMLKLWSKARRVATDTETRNLSATANKIYTAQFAFDAEGVDPTKGYIVVIDHPHEDNPFSVDERKYIKKKLRRLLGAETGPELITFNGMYDLRVYRQCLKLDIIYHKVWEIMAGEHLLDENISSMAGIGIKAGGLAAVYASYGNDFYFREDTTFSKSERNTIGSVSPNDRGFQMYAATDVVSILHIADAQVARSGYQTITSKKYTPFFERHMRHQMSDTVHVLSHLKQTGSKIDKAYLRRLMRPDSVLAKAIDELNEEFKTFPEVKKANQLLLEKAGFKTKSLFGKSNNQWMFSFNKPEHKAILFFEVCGLKAISKTATGADAIDKEFIEHYKDRNYLVAKFGEYQAASKLLSTYIKGWYKKLSREIDGATDSHLRADYTFFNVDTGRLASQDPNLQNIPARGKLSKIIKEMFITEDGCLLIRFDYSAHEVRGWSIAAGDLVLAAAFKAGQKLRQLFIKTPTDEINKELKTKGDIHIQNVFRFFGKWVEKSDPLRDAIKAVVFGVLYGKSAATLGNDTKRNDLDAAKAKIAEAYKAKDTKALDKAVKAFEAILEEDRTERAQEIIDKMFAEFKRGDQWVKRMQKMASEMFYVFSPIGRIRHLFAAMTGVRSIISRQVRRGMNAPIQGFASEIAVKASLRVLTAFFKDRAKIDKMLGREPSRPVKFNRIVHDALYFTVPYEMVIPFIHMLQYEATYGVAQAYEREFGLKFTVEPEIEMEIGTKDTNSTKWNWALPELKKIIESSVDDGIKAGLLTEEREEILEKIWAPWHNKECLSFLDKNYPLLGVSLKKEIRDVVRA